MSNALTIEFDEGETWPVVFNLPDDFDLTPYAATIEVRREVGAPVIMSFSTANGSIEKQGSSLLIRVLPAQSAGKAGQYKYQLKLAADPTDVIKFPVEKFIINKAFNP